MTGAPDETPEDVFDEVISDLMAWRWERWSTGTAAEFQARVAEDARVLRERFEAARRREREQH